VDRQVSFGKKMSFKVLFEFEEKTHADFFSDIFSLTGGTCASMLVHFSSQLACNFNCANALGICEPVLKAVFYFASHVAGFSTGVVCPW